MPQERTSLANRAVMRLWQHLGHGKKPPLSAPAIAVCDATDDILIEHERRMADLARRIHALENSGRDE